MIRKTRFSLTIALLDSADEEIKKYKVKEEKSYDPHESFTDEALKDVTRRIRNILTNIKNYGEAK